MRSLPWESDSAVAVRGAVPASYRLVLVRTGALPSARAYDGDLQVTVQPGPGEPAPASGRRASHEAPFREPVDAWLAAGADRPWWIAVDGIPPVGHSARKRVLDRLHAAWTRELRGRGLTTGRGGEFGASLVRENGQDYWRWGRNETEAS